MAAQPGRIGAGRPCFPGKAVRLRCIPRNCRHKPVYRREAEWFKAPATRPFDVWQREKGESLPPRRHSPGAASRLLTGRPPGASALSHATIRQPEGCRPGNQGLDTRSWH